MNKKQSERFGNFFDRVQTERAALKIVNERFSDAKKLHGLTEAAINSWFSNTQKADGSTFEYIEVIASILRRLSVRIDALADQSRAVFSDERFPMLPSDEILFELASACREQELKGPVSQ